MKTIGIGVLLLSLGAAGSAETAPLPISTFASMEQFSNPAISPDGHYLAYVMAANGQRFAVVQDLKRPDVPPKGVMKPDTDNKFRLTWCKWANDTRLLCAYISTIKLDGDIGRTTRLVGVNADGSELKVLQQDTIDTLTFNQADVIDFTPNDPATILVHSVKNNSRFVINLSTHPSVYELNIYTGAMREHTRPFAPISSFYSDQRGNIRLGIGYTRKLSDSSIEYYARLKDDKDWRKLSKVAVFEATEAAQILAVIPGTNNALAVKLTNGRNALWQIDLEDKEPPRMVFSHPTVDVDTPIMTNEGEMIGVFYETDRPFIYYTDLQTEQLMQTVNAAVPDGFNVIVDATRDRSFLVIRSLSDVNSGFYYLYDVKAKKIQLIGRARPDLNPKELPRMRSIEYPAKDGTSIPGYLTTPANVRPEKLPLIVMPHGGPRARDSWEFDFLRHFLANRGYAVLQMNFRGSTGYGDKWYRAAFQDWGGLTYSDIVDATHWAVAQGIADPQRICVVGWSFGGYAALLSAARDSSLYKCAVSIAGVSDLADLEISRSGRSRILIDQQIGTDKEKLRADSPVKHAADMKIPILMIHGTRDVQAPYSHSENMATALRRVDKAYKLVTINDADHSLARESERVTLLTEIEQFLQAHLGKPQ